MLGHTSSSVKASFWLPSDGDNHVVNLLVTDEAAEGAVRVCHRFPPDIWHRPEWIFDFIYPLIGQCQSKFAANIAELLSLTILQQYDIRMTPQQKIKADLRTHSIGAAILIDPN